MNCEHFVTKLKYGKPMSDQGKHPKPGDLIEFQRVGYQHWAIYMGDGDVVHLTDQDGKSSISSVMNSSAVVRKDPLEKVAEKDNYRVNNKYDEKRKPLPTEKVLRAALEKVGKRMKYNITTENCEHFVTQLRNGRSFSDQVKNVMTHVTAVATVLLSAFAVFMFIKPITYISLPAIAWRRLLK
uniref:LRAT domain-containing protein n=1 Tax=Leptobrachium leishanense TaxID=445787 RepID=A0A8C5R6H4_9ANUR